MNKLKRKQVFRVLFILPLPNHAPFIDSLFQFLFCWFSCTSSCKRDYQY